MAGTTGTTRTLTDTAARLRSVTWNFDTSRSSLVHNLHPYPAKFIPDIPRELIQLFHPGDGSPVLDPFCGSGTTLVEAQALGLPSVGVDLHPLATLIAKVKTTPISESLSDTARTILELAQSTPAPVPDIPRLDHWFKPSVQKALARIVLQLGNLPDGPSRDALRIALSRIIVRVSNQESDTRYAAIRKNVDENDVYEQYQKSVGAVSKALNEAHPPSREAQELLISNGQPPTPLVLTHDLMTLPAESLPTNIGLVVTSPPYPNAYEYWLYHKYRMYWLGMDPIAVRTSEIGARPHYFKRNHQTEHDFEDQMETCFVLLSRVMQEEACACFVVGRSIIHGREIDNHAILKRAAEAAGFHHRGSVERDIRSSRKSFNLSHADIKTESIAIFQLHKDAG